MKLRTLCSALATAGVLAFAGGAQAILITGSSGSLSASADFSQSGSNLVVTLTNTSAADVLAPGDVLTAVFFDILGAPGLGRVSGLLAGGSTVFYDNIPVPNGQPAGGVIGGEWAYKSGLAGAPLGATEGISSAGFSLFGPGDLFPGPDLDPPASPNGVNYGLLSAGDNTATGNGGITGSGGIIKNSAVFTLSLPTGFILGASNITNVSFQYGTALTETNVTCDRPGGCGPQETPEPGSLALIGLALGALGLIRRRMLA